MARTSKKNIVKPSEEKLTLIDIESAYGNIFQSKIVTVNVGGKDYDVKVETNLPQNKIKSLVMEILEKQQHIESMENILEVPDYIVFLVLKYMTDLDVLKIDDFKQQMRVYNILLNLDVIDKIMENINPIIFDKINEYIKKFNQNAQDIKSNPDYDKIVSDFGKIFNGIQRKENGENLS